jgi:filamentous hemagglutinin family protein
MSRQQRRAAQRFAPLAGGTLCATLLATTALAQPAPNAHPMGGQVAAGQASISQSATTTTINQASQRAVVNWQSFNVGANQTVQFVQPATTSTTLNRVLSPDPSQIAGHITANGQIVLQNQSGVVFAKGAQVDAASLVVSAPGITDQNFMAGKMVFDVPAKPDAQIVNNGRITVKQSGLAALVAPQVANNGVISAKMGHVVLAGAQAETVDLYGDGMVSINVTGQVTQAPVGPDGRPDTALVTNSGVIAASGGTVELTARAVDGIVQTLVTAGGRISAHSVGGQTGKVVVSGIGGSVIVAGDISATGRAPGTTGGAIKVNASNGVTVAAGAHINASGAAGGGTVAIGTTLARARGGPSVTSTHTAATATIAKGALVTANATQSGNGGTVVVLSSQSTSVSGEIDTRGGPLGGNGGHVEMSGQAGFGFDGTVDATARTTTGLAGTILIDPRDLYISSTNPVTLSEASGDTTLTSGTSASSPGSLPGSSTDAWVTPASINNLSGAVTLTATRDVDVLTSLNTTGSGITALTLEAGRNLMVYAGAPITTAGSLIMSAGNALIANAALTAGGSIALIAQHTTGTIPTGYSNAFTLNDPVTAGAGQTISFSVPAGYNFYSASAPNGTLEIGPSTAAAAANLGFGKGASDPFDESIVRIGTTSLPGALVAVNIQLGNSTYGPNINNYGSATLDLHATGTVSEYATSAIEAAALTGSVGTLNLPNAGNSIGTLGAFNATGDVTLATNGSLVVSQPLVAGGNIALTAEDSLIANAAITAGGNIALTDLFNSGSAPSGYQDGMTLNQPVTAGAGKTLSLAVAGGEQFNTLAAPQGTVEIGPSTSEAAANFSFGVDSTGTQVIANTVRIGTTSLPGALVANNITLGDANHSGLNNYGTATIDLHATGDVASYQDATSIQAGAITGSVGSLVLYDDYGNSIGSIGPLTATTTIELYNGGPLTVGGTLTGEFIYLVSIGSMTLSSNIVINPTCAGCDGYGYAFFYVLPDTGGNANFMQTGTTQVSQIGSGSSTVYALTDGMGNLVFNDLEAPNSLLYVYTSDGAISGKVNVGNLSLLSYDYYYYGYNGGSVNLTNTTVGGLTGAQAAAATTIYPSTISNYLVNGCVAGSSACSPVMNVGSTGTGTGTTNTGTLDTTSTGPTNTGSSTGTASTGPASTDTTGANSNSTVGSNTGAILAPSTPTVIPTIPPTPAPAVTPEELQAAAATATNIAVTTPVVTGVSSVVTQLSIGSIAPNDIGTGGTNTADTSTATTGPVGTGEQGQARTEQRGVPLVNPLGEMSRGPLRNRSADPDLVVPNVSERDY